MGSSDALPGMQAAEPPRVAPRLVDVALNKPLAQAFTYRVPDELVARVKPGVRVAVPFGRRREVGIVVDLPESSDLPTEKLRARSWRLASLTRTGSSEPNNGRCTRS